jgi:hypothetical protein
MGLFTTAFFVLGTGESSADACVTSNSNAHQDQDAKHKSFIRQFDVNFLLPES